MDSFVNRGRKPKQRWSATADQVVTQKVHTADRVPQTPRGSLGQMSSLVMELHSTCMNLMGVRQRGHCTICGGRGAEVFSFFASGLRCRQGCWLRAFSRQTKRPGGCSRFWPVHRTQAGCWARNLWQGPGWPLERSADGAGVERPELGELCRSPTAGSLPRKVRPPRQNPTSRRRTTKQMSHPQIHRASRKSSGRREFA